MILISFPDLMGLAAAEILKTNWTYSYVHKRQVIVAVRSCFSFTLSAH